MPIHEIRHPLIRHKLGLMRRGDLSTKNFREMAQEVAALLTYEASKDLPLETEVVQGWCGDVTVERLAGTNVTGGPQNGSASGRGRGCANGMIWGGPVTL